MINPCPHCGRPNREGARFCAECGAALAATPPPVLAGDTADAATGVFAAPVAPEAAETAAATPAATAVDTAGPLPLDPLPPDPLPPDPLPPDPLTGTWLGGRFYIRGASDTGDTSDTSNTDGARFYIAEDHGICPLCGTETGSGAVAGSAATADEPYCTNCGANLLLTTLSWPLRRLAEIAPDAPPAETVQNGAEQNGTVQNGAVQNGSRRFTAAGRTFALLDDPAAAAAAAAPESDAADHAAGETADPAPAPSIFLLAGQRSDVGIERAGRANEDSLFALTLTAPAAEGSAGVYIVADGMGGHMDGEVASRTACAVISAEVLAGLGWPGAGMESGGRGLAVTAGAAAPDYGDLQPLPLLERAVQAANREIFAAAGAVGSNMGSTAVVALVVDGQAAVANVGDSRAYLWRAGTLRQLTADHSHVFMLVQKGLIDEAAIYTHPRRNEIYRSLGFGPNVEVDCLAAALHPGDLLLLCSDGLWEMLRSEGIADVLDLNLRDPQVICDELVRRANLAGGEDNISVIAVRAVGALGALG